MTIGKNIPITHSYESNPGHKNSYKTFFISTGRRPLESQRPMNPSLNPHQRVRQSLGGWFLPRVISVDPVKFPSVPVTVSRGSSK